jgi:hypothetical protein
VIDVDKGGQNISDLFLAIYRFSSFVVERSPYISGHEGSLLFKFSHSFRRDCVERLLFKNCVMSLHALIWLRGTHVFVSTELFILTG